MTTSLWLGVAAVIAAGACSRDGSAGGEHSAGDHSAAALRGLYRIETVTDDRDGRETVDYMLRKHGKKMTADGAVEVKTGRMTLEFLDDTVVLTNELLYTVGDHARWCVTSAGGDLRRRGERFDMPRMVANARGGVAAAAVTVTTECDFKSVAMTDVTARALADGRLELVANTTERGKLTMELVPETERTIDWKAQAKQLVARD